MITIIVAMANNRVIGNQNRLPWHNLEDMAHFKLTTLHHSVVMGRKTYESIGRPLPNRINYVLTTQADYRTNSSAIVIRDIHVLVNQFKHSKDILYVIGGAEIYNLFLPFCDSILLSLIPGQFNGDAYFPIFENQFHLVKKESKNTFELYYYERSINQHA